MKQNGAVYFYNLNSAKGRQIRMLCLKQGSEDRDSALVTDRAGSSKRNKRIVKAPCNRQCFSTPGKRLTPSSSYYYPPPLKELL